MGKARGVSYDARRRRKSRFVHFCRSACLQVAVRRGTLVAMVSDGEAAPAGAGSRTKETLPGDDLQMDCILGAGWSLFVL